MDKLSPAQRLNKMKASLAKNRVVDVVLIASGDFFLQRDKKMEPREGEFASKVLEALTAQQREQPQARAIVVCLHDQQKWMKPHLEGIPFLRVFRMKDGAVGETTVRLKNMLIELGVKFRPTRNARAMSYLNLDKFARGGLTMIRSDDYDKIGIEPEKEVTFQDLVKKRRRSAWP